MKSPRKVWPASLPEDPASRAKSGPRDGIVRDRKVHFDLLEIGGPYVLGVVYTHQGEKRLQRSQPDHRQQDWRSERWGKSRRSS
jgi:hypothetical protein